MSNAFISYSRHDFYFAETLAVELRAAGRIHPWLDVAELQPGADWSVAIDAALDEADLLVLVASPAALRSTYVRNEWTRALAAGKPVHIALARRTRLPPELAGAPVHDLRGSLRQAARWMSGLPTEGYRAFPLPWQVALLYLAILQGTLATAAGAVYSFYVYQGFRTVAENPILRHEVTVGWANRISHVLLVTTIVDLLIALGSIGILVALVRRRATAATIQDLLSSHFLSLLFLLVPLLSADMRLYREHSTPTPPPVATSAWVYISAIFAFIIGMRLVRASSAVRLRIPTGEDALRLLRLMPTIDYPLGTYDLYYHSADSVIADRFAKSCDKSGMYRDSTSAQWTFFLVSSHTDMTRLLHAPQVFGPGTVFVLVASIQLSIDSHQLRRYQWLDFRRQDTLELRTQLGRLNTMPAAVPVAADRFRLPPTVALGLTMIRSALAYTVAVPLAQFIAGFTVSSLLSTVLTIAIVAMLIRLAIATATRDIDLVSWRRQARWLWLLYAVWATFPAIIAGGRLANSVIALAAGVLITLWGRAASSRWLPPTTSDPTPHIMKPVPPPVRDRSLPMITMFVAGYIGTLTQFWQPFT